jgi:predicted RNase H-like HicB family nuclease
MKTKKLTVILLSQPDGGYQVFFPWHPNCITEGETVEEALKNGKEALELLLEVEAEQGNDTSVEDWMKVSDVVVRELDIKVPTSGKSKTKHSVGVKEEKTSYKTTRKSR